MNYPDLAKFVDLELQAFLQSDPLIGTRNVIQFNPGDVADIVLKKISQSIGTGTDGKVGIGIVCHPVQNVRWPDKDVAFASCQLPLIVDIYENVTLNHGHHGTKKSCAQWAMYLAKIMSSYAPANLTTDWIPETDVVQFFMAAMEHDPDNILRGARVSFHTFESDTAQFQQCSSPYLTTDHPLGGAYPYNVIIQADAGATVYYTTDGSNPWPGIPAGADGKFPGIATSAVKWDGNPVPVTGACLFRARAFNPAAGWLGSSCSSISFDGLFHGVMPMPPLIISDGGLQPTVENTGAVDTWPFKDQVTGQIVYLRVIDGEIVLAAA